MATVGISFPGVLQPHTCVATEYLGPLPSVAILQYLPQAALPAFDGDLTWGHGAETRTWYFARVDHISVEITPNGQMFSARIFDRRFWWKFTSITGVYNERRSIGAVVARTEKTVWELAELLLEAMGEDVFGWDISVLPNNADDRPFVDWDNANPAYELERLCNERGCSISLVQSTSQVVIVELGQGISLPSDDVQTLGVGHDLGEYPEILGVIAGLKFQAKLKLEAVGIDLDGEIKPIDDLSYKPAEGWGYQWPEGGLLPEADEESRSLARKSVYRLFRIAGFADDTLNVPVYGPITEMDQILPLGEGLAEVYVDGVSGRVMQKPYRLEGRYVVGDTVEQLQLMDPGTAYEGQFFVHRDTGIVEFPESSPMYKWDTEDYVARWHPADLYLETSFRVRNGTHNQYEKYFISTTLVGGVGVRYIPRPELEVIIIIRYDDESPTEFASPAYEDNIAAIETAAGDVLAAALPEFLSHTSLDVTYRSTKSVDTDGANRQVTHIISRNTGANTRVGQNMEPEPGVLRSPDRAIVIQNRQAQQQSRYSQQQIESFNLKRIGVR